jgi:hypothetical protein
MAAESETDVHHGTPRCLLELFDAAGGDVADWSEFDAEAERLGIEVRGLSREELRALIEGSTHEIPTTELRRLHQQASDFVRWGRRGGRRTLSLYGRPYSSHCSPASARAWLRWRPLPGTVPGVQRDRAAAIRPRVYNHGVRVHNRRRRRVVEEIIGRLPKLTEAQLGRLEDELRRERRRRASSAGGRADAPCIQKGAAPPVTRKSWSTDPTRTVVCSWSYAATSVVTAPPASADPTGTSSTTMVASVGSSTLARPATQRAPWPPSGQSPWGSRSLPWSGSARKDEKR